MSKILVILIMVLLVVSFCAPATRVEDESLPLVRIGIGGYLKEGVLNGQQTETAAQTFIESKLDWIWMYWSHSLLGIGSLPLVDALQAAGKRIILRTWWWRSGVPYLGDGTWTTLYNDDNAYNAVLDSIIAQVRETGGPDGSNIYAFQLGEAEPMEGYGWNYTAVNLEHFVNVSNRLYDDIKATFPNLRVFVGLEAGMLGAGREVSDFSQVDPAQLDFWVRQIKKDGLHMATYYPISSMGTFYDLILRYKDDPDVNGELYTHTFCSTMVGPWYGEGYRQPDYARAQFELAVAKGIPNIAFFQIHVRPDGQQEALFFNDYVDDPSVPAERNPYLMKQVMLDLLEGYADLPLIIVPLPELDFPALYLRYVLIGGDFVWSGRHLRRSWGGYPRMGGLFLYQHNLTLQFCNYISHAHPSSYYCRRAYPQSASVQPTYLNPTTYGPRCLGVLTGKAPRSMLTTTPLGALPLWYKID